MSHDATPLLPLQKDMEQQYLCMTSGDSDVDTAMTWLSQLNVSATQYGLEVMYSGALPRLAMEAAFRHTASPAVSPHFLLPTSHRRGRLVG